MKRIFRDRIVLQNVLANTGWLIGDRTLRYGLGFFVGAWMARYLGPEQFGVLNYVLAIVAILCPLIGNGLDNILIRELVQLPGQKYEILGTAFFMRLIGGFLVFIFSSIVAAALRPGDQQSLILVALLASSSLLLATDVIELWFQSQMLSKYAIFAKGLAFLIILLVKAVLILYAAPLYSFIVAGCAEALLGAIGLVIYFQQTNGHIRQFRASMTMFRSLIRKGWPLILVGLAAIICLRIDQIFIAQMLGDTEVGIYSAAAKFTEFAYAVPALISISVLPILVESRTKSDSLYEQRLQRFYDLMTLGSIAGSLLLAVSSKIVIALFFGAAFDGAALILAVQIWSSVFVFLAVASNQHFIIENRAEICLYRTLIGAAANIVLNLVLIPLYGIMGAAIASVVSNMVIAFSIIFIKSSAPTTAMLLRSFELTRTIKVLVSLYRSHDKPLGLDK